MTIVMPVSTGMESNPCVRFLVPSLIWEQQAEGVEIFIYSETGCARDAAASVQEHY